MSSLLWVLYIFSLFLKQFMTPWY